MLVHLVLLVHRVEGVTPGLYVLPRSEAGLVALGAAMRKEFAWTPADPILPLYQLIAAKAERTARTVSCHQDIASHSAFTVMFVLLPRLGVAANSPILNTEPVAALVMAWALLGQTIAPLQLLGCGVVVLAVVALGLRR